jgi:hypothetical protein
VEFLHLWSPLPGILMKSNAPRKLLQPLCFNFLFWWWRFVTT